MKVSKLRRLGALSITLAALFVFLGSASAALADEALPNCYRGKLALKVDNAQVLAWKQKTPNQYKDRGFVAGVVVDVHADRPSHDHFSIMIGPSKSDTVELIYNKEFGDLPDLRVGMKVEACGDYITANAPSGPYPASPAGAIIHWLHMNPSGTGHEHGFVRIDGKVYGDKYSGKGSQKRRARPRAGLSHELLDLAPLFQ